MRGEIGDHGMGMVGGGGLLAVEWGLGGDHDGSRILDFYCRVVVEFMVR
jgi:hypothetical protein